MVSPSLSGPRHSARLLAASLLVMALPACNTAQRLSDVGGAPGLSKIEDPQGQPGYTPVSLPMPTPQPTQRNPNSLWRNGARAFFKDQRAGQVGDLLTVVIAIADTAKVTNSTSRTRANGEHVGLPNLLGFEAIGGNGASAMTNALTGVSASDLANMASSSNSAGTGAVTRGETVNLKLAASVTQVLPNGYLVIHGKQEVRINFEMRELTVDGVVRPEDISATNQIPYERIAEARISYGGRGQLTDVQQPRYGQQLWDIISPF